MKKFLVLWLILQVSSAFAQSQTESVVPPAESQFVNGSGQPYSGGNVFFYVPGTTTPSSTWQDPYGLTLNANPVHLDSAGRAIIWGSGLYRQVLVDQFGNTVWDQLTFVAAPNGAVGTGTGLTVLQTAPTIISPALTGVPTAPTAVLGTNTTQVATTAFVAAAVAAIVPPTNAVPSAAVMYFDLSSCPAGWVPANGTAGTADMRGVYPRGQDNGRGLDITGTGIAGFENFLLQQHTMAAASGSFVTSPGSIVIGNSGGFATIALSPSTGPVNSGSVGNETRPYTTVLLACQKS